MRPTTCPPAPARAIARREALPVAPDFSCARCGSRTYGAPVATMSRRRPLCLSCGIAFDLLRGAGGGGR